MNNHFLSKEYFPEKHYKDNNSSTSSFDIIFDKNSCSSFKKNNEICNRCFNDALIEKMQELSSLEKLDFINYQLNLYKDPLDYLKRMNAFLNDNEDNFDSFNYSMVIDYRNIVTQGIEQLSESDIPKKKKSNNNSEFINQERIEDLEGLDSKQFDLSRLICMTNEINFSFSENNFISVILLTRALIDHIPPIFEQKNFSAVYGSYGSKSFKESMKHLDASMRKIADSYLHTHIRKKESLPTITQVNFSPDVDVLLAEIIRKLSE